MQVFVVSIFHTHIVFLCSGNGQSGGNHIVAKDGNAVGTLYSNSVKGGSANVVSGNNSCTDCIGGECDISLSPKSVGVDCGAVAYGVYIGIAGPLMTVHPVSTVSEAVQMILAQGIVGNESDGVDHQLCGIFPLVSDHGFHMAFSFVGILQSLGEFNVPALISTVSNLVIIAYFLTLDSQFGIYGLAVAFLVGWLLQALVQVPSLKKKGFHYYPSLEWRSEGMGKAFALMVPVMVSTWVQPINLTINSRFGSHLYDGAGVSAIEISTNLYLIIAGVFVLSVTNVIFPELSRLTAGDRQEQFQDTLRQALRGTLFFVFPMSAGLMAVARPLVSFIYGGGEFDDFSVSITTQGLVWVSLGMAGYAIQNILSRAYFARQEGRAPLVAGAVSIVVNIALCMALTGPMGVAGLALSSAVSSTVYALLLMLPLSRSGHRIFTGAFLLDLGKMLLSAAVMGAAVFGLEQILSFGLPGGKAGELLLLGLGAAAGVAVYFLCAAVLKLPEVQTVRRLAAQILKRG